MTRRIIPILIALMGFIHIGATFSPLISGKLGALDTNTYPASGRVMEKCGFKPTGETAVDELLHTGKERPMRVLRLEL